MKKIITLIITIIVLQTRSNAQSYTPLPTTFAIWTTSYYGLSLSYIKFGMFGDTMINNYSYKKIYESYAYHFNLDSATYAGAIREENKKVYVIYRIFNSESLLYNFNLNVGDTAKTISSGGTPFSAKVDSIDYTIVNGQSRKRWKFNAFGFHNNEYWIEGIGSTFDLLSPIEYGSDQCKTLLCVSKDSNLIYSYVIPATPECRIISTYDCDEYLATSLPEKNEEELKTVIVPNPVSSSALLRVNTELDNARLIIYNSFGEEVMKYSNLKGKEITIHKGNLTSGIYYYKLTQASKIISTGKFIIE